MGIRSTTENRVPALKTGKYQRQHKIIFETRTIFFQSLPLFSKSHLKCQTIAFADFDFILVKFVFAN